MAAFRRVEDARAGVTAVGILVPPGARTFVIVRPRALKWDLLPAVPETDEDFCHFSRDEAAALARNVLRDLQDFAETNDRLRGGVRRLANGFQVWVRVSRFDWILCPRNPGAPYRPLLFPDQQRAQDALSGLLPFLQPAQNAEQEYYFNTQNFARS